MNFRSGNQEKSLDGDNVTLLHLVIYSHFEAHTPPKHGAACLSFLWPIAGVHYGSFYFFCFVSGSCVYTIVHTFCHFPCLPLTSKDEITSNHRHSPMIFRSGNQEKSLDGDNVTLLHLVIYSHFEAHTPPKHGAACLSFLWPIAGVHYGSFYFFLWCVNQNFDNLATEISLLSLFLSFFMSSTQIQRWNHIKT